MTKDRRTYAWTLAALVPACALAARLPAPQRAALPAALPAVRALPRLPHPTARPARARLLVPPPEPSAPYRRLFRRLLRTPELTDRYDAIIMDEAAKRGLDPRLLKSIVAAESEFNPQGRSPKGATGLMQLLPETARGQGISRRMLKEPRQNIAAGASYIAELYGALARRHGLSGTPMKDAPAWAVQRVIAAYHAGPRYLERPSLLKSTRLYVRKVLLFYGSGVTELRRPTS